MTEEESLHARLALLVPINNFEPQQQEQVFRSAEILEIKKKEYIFRQGDRDNWSFYVVEGQVEMYSDDQLIKRVVGGEGASFHALAQLQPRQMSAQAKSKIKVLRVDRGLLDRLLSVENVPGPAELDIEVTEIETSASGDWLTDMLQSELFAHVPPSNIQKLLETLESIEYTEGDVVIEQGAAGDYYYAIQSGRCEVLRLAKNGKPIKLAELGPGARFGEEALVSNAKRNATVKMLTDGELARLTKADFVELIKTPVMRKCSLDEVRSLVAEGAQLLDVRFPEEHGANGLEGSRNIPLSNLRSSHHELDHDQQYIVYCDTGGRSSAATFLLAQEGYNVCYVEGGAIDEVPPEQTAKSAAAKRPARQPPPPETVATTQQDEIVEADIRAQSLAADLEKAKLQIELAQRVMAEAQAAKQEADRHVAEKLQAERAKIDEKTAAVEARLAEAQAAKQEAESLVAEKLQAERAKIDEKSAAVEARLAEAQAAKQEAESFIAEKLQAERTKIDEKTAAVETRLAEAQAAKQEAESLVAEKLQAERAKIDEKSAAVEARLAEAQAAKQEAESFIAEKLQAERTKIDEKTAAVEARIAEAERLKDEIERQQALAAGEAERRHREQDERTAALEREAESRLQEKEERIEELYRQQAEKLDNLDQEREKSRAELEQAWEAIENESTLSKERLEAARELENELLSKEQQRAKELEEKENQMRAALQSELDIERKKLEAAFAKTADEIDRARREQEAAEAAKRAAAEEAQRIIQEYKQAQERLQAEQTAKLLRQRQQIETDAARLKIQLDEAAKARTEAEAIKREAEAQLADTRQRHQSIDATETNLRDEIAAIEERARAATERLRNAVAVENTVEHEHRESEKRLERTYGTENEINLLLQKELDEWVSEQERAQGSTARRDEIDKQRQQTERIKTRAVQAQRDTVKHDATLLDEIALQLEAHS